MVVYTLTLISDGESDVRVFRTEGARDEALKTEAFDRFEATFDAGDWTKESVVEEPAEFINDDSYGDVDVSLARIVVEG